MVLPRTRLWPRCSRLSAKARLARACARLACACAEGGLERPAVDGEQQVALLDHLPVLEMDRVEIAGDARAHLDGIDRDEAADVLVVIGDQPLHRLGDRHLRRWGWSSLGARLAPNRTPASSNNSSAAGTRRVPSKLDIGMKFPGRISMVHRSNMGAASLAAAGHSRGREAARSIFRSSGGEVLAPSV